MLAAELSVLVLTLKAAKQDFFVCAENIMFCKNVSQNQQDVDCFLTL